MLLPPAAIEMAAAGLAGALGATVVYPIDLLKTRLQSTVVQYDSPVAAARRQQKRAVTA